MDRETLRELAADVAQGSAGAAEQAALWSALSTADSETRQEISHLFDVAALLSAGLAKTPPAGLKGKVLAGIKTKGAGEGGASQKAPAIAAIPGMSFVWGHDQGDWKALPAPGASMKVLSMTPGSEYAVVLGKLEPGSRYPAHSHIASEQVYVLSGDLVIGETKLKAGDFHEAAAGSSHGVNYSETGCVILAVISQKDLQAQLAMMS